MIQPHAVTVVTPAVVTDRRQSQSLSYGDDATRVTVSGFMQQKSASESLGDRDERVSGWALFSTSTPTLTALDHIEWNGDVFLVAGQPDHLWNSRTYSHTEADLKLVEG